MRILVHIVVCYLILGLSFVHSTLPKDFAQILSLTGPFILAVIEWCPLVLLLSYALIVFATRKSPVGSARIVGAIVVAVLALVGTYYPDWLVKRYSQKIEIGQFVRDDDMFLPAEEIRRFEQTFGTPTAQYSETGGGPWLVVRRDKYSPAMVAFLREEAQRKTKPDGALDQTTKLTP